MLDARRMYHEQLKVRAKAVLRAVLRATVYIVGKDTTYDTGGRACVVLAPHPDDETIACGITVMRKLSSGTSVTVVVVTDGAAFPEGRQGADLAAIRRSELRAACAALGLPPRDVLQLDLPDTRLSEHYDFLVRTLQGLFEQCRPDEVLVSASTDPHEDHAVLGRAAREARLALQHRFTFRLLEYPVWQWEWLRSWPKSLSGRPEIVRSGEFRKRKRAALAQYRSQLKVTDGGQLEKGLPAGVMKTALGHFEVFFPVAYNESGLDPRNAS
ncbi:MAG: PIG-L deacetylase family protein [Acidimicrobiales bacterium]